MGIPASESENWIRNPISLFWYIHIPRFEYDINEALNSDLYAG